MYIAGITCRGIMVTISQRAPTSHRFLLDLRKPAITFSIAYNTKLQNIWNQKYRALRIYRTAALSSKSDNTHARSSLSLVTIRYFVALSRLYYGSAFQASRFLRLRRMVTFKRIEKNSLPFQASRFCAYGAW